MDIKQAYKILEIPEDSSFTAIREAYRDLAKVWHPDRHSHDERLHRKAQEKMKELNEAYDVICLHLKTDDSSGLQREGERQGQGSPEHIVACLSCGTKNRMSASADYLLARCGRCGSFLFDVNPKQQYEYSWQIRKPCGDGRCVGIIDSAGRCTRCGRTFEEGVAEEREATEARMSWFSVRWNFAFSQ
jgi:DNA-directed RNA polymerase subunit RPC12/RpoP